MSITRVDAAPPRPGGSAWAVAAIGMAFATAGCGPGASSIKIDGSSTVYPISEAVAEEFLRGPRPDVRVTVGYSGTGGGMKKFTAGEIDICDASRAIKETETAALEAAGVPYIELSAAFDGIAVVVNPQNDWVDCLTVAQLAAMWRPDEPAQKWSDVEPDWPDERIRLYGPGTDSGTFDYFTKAIVGEEKACRSDFAASEDDNVLVTGIANDKYALGYFGFAYYDENRDTLKVLGVRQENGDCVKPEISTIRSNEYRPLSRPLYLYVRHSLLERPEGVEFVQFYLDESAALATEVGYVPVSDEVDAENRRRLAAAIPAQPAVLE